MGPGEIFVIAALVVLYLAMGISLGCAMALALVVEHQPVRWRALAASVILWPVVLWRSWRGSL